MTDDKKKLIEPEFNLALQLRETDMQESIRILKDLDRRFPDTPTIVGMVAANYHSLRDWTNALPWFEKAVFLAPKSELASVGLFHTLCRHGRFDEAFAEARRFMALVGVTEEYGLLFSDLDDDGIFD